MTFNLFLIHKKGRINGINDNNNGFA